MTRPGVALDWSRLAVPSSSLPDTVSSMLDEVLADGRIPAGTRLPSERDLAAQLGVSRASVREAIHELMLKGLVTRRPGRGTIVTEAGDRRLGDSLLGVMPPASRDLRAILDFREAIEPPIASRAALRATSADIQNLAGAVQAMEANPSRSEYAEMDRKFHDLVARATHNPLLGNLSYITGDWMASIRGEAFQSTTRRRASLAGHRAILDAIAQHDGNAAAAATVAHVRQIGTIVFASGKTRRGNRRLQTNRPKWKEEDDRTSAS
jgi:GntR family transcriptional regulator, transcriptional repressor for pyruvate dehydrogenase complex